MAAFPQPVLDNIELAKDMFLDLDEQSNNNIIDGCLTCEVENYHCMFLLLRDLSWKAAANNFDDIAIILYNKLMLITGGAEYTPPSDYMIYFGGVDTTEELTIEEVLSLSSMPYTLGTPIIVPFNIPSFKVPVLALSTGIPIPNHYTNENNPFDTGNLGSTDDLLNDAYALDNFNVMQGNYVAIITDPLLFDNI